MYQFVLNMACGEMISTKNLKLKNKKFRFILLHLIFFVLLLLHRPSKTVGTFRASP